MIPIRAGYLYAAMIVIFIAILFMTVQEADTERQAYKSELDECAAQKEELQREGDLDRWHVLDGSLVSPRVKIQESNTEIHIHINQGGEVYLLFTIPPPENVFSDALDDIFPPNARFIQLSVVVWPFPYIEEGEAKRILFASNDEWIEDHADKVYRPLIYTDSKWIVDHILNPPHTRILIAFPEKWYGKIAYADFDFAGVNTLVRETLRNL